jgi:membrane protein implicated in regulation of membrane protease activity
MAIEKLITEYHNEGYINYISRTQDNCFVKYRNDDGKLDKKKLFEDLDYVDLSCIEPNLLVDAPKPSIASVFTINKKLLFLAFSAFLLMMMGKVVAIVYEKIGYKNWLFYTFSGLALVVLFSTIYVNSTLSSLDTEKSQIEKGISSLESKITKIQKEYENSIQFDEDEPDKWKNFKITAETQKKLQKEKIKLPKIEKNISSYSFWVSLLVMLAELVIGAVAWMTYSDYIKKKKDVEVSGEGYVERLKQEKEDLESLIKQYKEQIIEKETNDEKAQELSASLTTLLGSIHTNEEIEEIIESYKK